MKTALTLHIGGRMINGDRCISHALLEPLKFRALPSMTRKADTAVGSASGHAGVFALPRLVPAPQPERPFVQTTPLCVCRHLCASPNRARSLPAQACLLSNRNGLRLLKYYMSQPVRPSSSPPSELRTFWTRHPSPDCTSKY
jgi:hypothetical protein